MWIIKIIWFILLYPQEYNAKLSDFGLAKDGPVGDESHVSTRIMGTYGYAAPEYIMTGEFLYRWTNCTIYQGPLTNDFKLTWVCHDLSPGRFAYKVFPFLVEFYRFLSSM